MTLVGMATSPMSRQFPRTDYGQSAAQQQQQKMGGVGIVFYRDSTSPYLVVKDVVHDGPAYRSSLIYPGDKLVCINDFDLAWSEKTPRSQQPQLPGTHGSSVMLTFDRSVDASYPERFTVTLVRSLSFYPDRLSSTSFKQSYNGTSNGTSRHSPRAETRHSPRADMNGNGNSRISSSAQKSPNIVKTETRSATRSSPLRAQPHSEVGWPQFEETPQVSRSVRRALHETPPPAQITSIHRPQTNSFIASSQIRGSNAPDPWVVGNKYGHTGSGKFDCIDSYPDPASPSSEIDDLINEIARKDHIVELQSRLSAGEIEHEKKIKEFQRNQTVLDEIVKSLRAEAVSERKRANDLERQLNSTLNFKGSPNIEAYESRIRDLQTKNERLENEQRSIREVREKLIVERDNALNRMSAFEKDARNRLQELQRELDRERVWRQELQQKQVDANVLRQLQTEKELLERQNEDLTRQLIELKMLLRSKSQNSPQQVQQEIRKNVATRAAAPAPSARPQSPSPEKIPGLQMEIQDEQSDDVEVHQIPNIASFSAHLLQANLKPQANLVPAQGSGSGSAYKPKDLSPQAKMISQQPQPPKMISQPPDLREATPQRSQTPIIPKLNLSRTSTPTPKSTTGVQAGIGMSFHPDPVSGKFIVTDVHPSGPAGQAVAQGSLAIGDALLAVNSTNLQGKTVAEIVEEILGPEGTAVMLTIARSYNGEVSSQTTNLSLVRASLARPGSKVTPSTNDNSGTHGFDGRSSSSSMQPRKSRSSSPSLQPKNSGSSSPSLQPKISGRPSSPSLQPKKISLEQSPQQDPIVLPPGWVTEVDSTSGRSYFVNHALKTFSWARPGQVVM